MIIIKVILKPQMNYLFRVMITMCSRCGFDYMISGSITITQVFDDWFVVMLFGRLFTARDDLSLRCRGSETGNAEALVTKICSGES